MESIKGNDYFNSYEDLEIHRLMLEDKPRTEAYRRAIFQNKSVFNGKTVMDVGAGTGILSIFCAQAGAKKVYAVEASKLAYLAEEIVKENSFENTIQVIHKKVEDVDLPNGEKIDIIVSEWMGFYLLHEGMLDSVFFARDAFLKSDGLMFPENATIYVAPCSVPYLNENWKDVHGVSMDSFAKKLRESKQNKPEITVVKPEELLAEETALCWIDMKDDTPASTSNYLINHVIGASKTGKFQGMCLWFDCQFPCPELDSEPVYLSTSPSSEATHWKQTVIVLPEERNIEEGEPIAWDLGITRSETDSRRYNINLTMQDPSDVEHPMPCSCHMTKCIVIRTFMLQHESGALNGEEKDEIKENGIDKVS